MTSPLEGMDEAVLDDELRKAMEAILLVVEEPVESVTLAQVLEAPVDAVEASLRALQEQWKAEGRGFVLREAAGGWRLYTDPGASAYVERFVLHGRSGRLSQAALETLAIVAYLQPVTRARISEIRGVEADAAVRSLAGRGLVEEVGRDDAPGQPLLYGTTSAFLERLGLSDVSELPPLPELSPRGALPEEPRPGEYRAARREIDALRSGGLDAFDPSDADAEPDADGGGQ